MKRTLNFLLVFALVLSTVTSAFAADGTEGSEQLQESENQTTVTVETLDELQTAVAAAEDGDTIAISTEITLDGVALETDKDITIVRADTYESGLLMRLQNGAKLSGFSFEDNSASTLGLDSSWETAVEIRNCHFKGDAENTQSFIVAGGGINYFNQFVIENCTFEGASYSAITSRSRLTLTVLNSVFTKNSTYIGG